MDCCHPPCCINPPSSMQLLVPTGASANYIGPTGDTGPAGPPGAASQTGAPGVDGSVSREWTLVNNITATGQVTAPSLIPSGWAPGNVMMTQMDNTGTDMYPWFSQWNTQNGTVPGQRLQVTSKNNPANFGIYDIGALNGVVGPPVVSWAHTNIVYVAGGGVFALGDTLVFSASINGPEGNTGPAATAAMPDFSIQYNSGSGNFAGHSSLTFKDTTSANLPDANPDGLYYLGRIQMERTLGNGEIAIGMEAGSTGQTRDAVAIGKLAGSSMQGQDSIAIGVAAGYSTQDNNAIAIGSAAGETDQQYDCVAIGQNAGRTSQQPQAIAIGNNAGNANQSTDAIAMGDNSAVNNQGVSSVAIGSNSAQQDQGDDAVALGVLAGKRNQGDNAVSVGARAGEQDQGDRAIAIGKGAGQGYFSIANTGQGDNAIAIGVDAGSAVAGQVGSGQGTQAIAIGTSTGKDQQGAGAIAVGNRAGHRLQPANAICIGNMGVDLQSQSALDGSIIINATGETASTFTDGGNSGFFVKPVRNVSGRGPLYYDPASGEITWSSQTAGHLATYSFATTRSTYSGGTTDYWGFASRGAGVDPIAPPGWASSIDNGGIGLFAIDIDITNILGTFGTINSGWLNNWHITAVRGGTSPNWEYPVVYNGIGTVTTANHGIRFEGFPSTTPSATPTSHITAYTSENLMPGHWTAGIFGPYQGDQAAVPDSGYGVANDRVPGSGTNVWENGFLGSTAATTNAANGWRPATANYVAAPRPNSSGKIVGLVLSGIGSAFDWGIWGPPQNTIPSQYEHKVTITISVVKGEFADRSTPGLNLAGDCCRDTIIADIFKVNRNGISSSSGGAVAWGQGPAGRDWVTDWGTSDYISFTGVSYLRLRTTIYVEAQDGAVSTSGNAVTPEISVRENIFKVGAQLSIIWDP